jgi:hypothetical protein
MTGSGFYAERKNKEAGVTVTRSPTVRIGMSAGVVRMLALIALPAVVAVVPLLAGGDIGSGNGSARDAFDRGLLAGHARLADRARLSTAFMPFG